MLPLDKDADNIEKYVEASADGSTAGSVVGIDALAERRLLWKLDLSLLPFFMLLFTINFVDRSSIGNARIAGLEKDLGMKGFDFNIALTMFYVAYLVSDLPSILVQKRVGSGWISVLVVWFGIVSLGTAFIHTYRQLIAIRILLGLAEGGLLSGLVYILSRYYRRKELVMRIGIFFGIAPSLAGAFGGLLASGLLTLDDFGQVRSWRKIFFVEGIITTGVGILAYFLVPSANPYETKMLNEHERALAIARLNADAVIKTNGRAEKPSFKLVRSSFSAFIWVCVTCYMFIAISFQGLSLFLPTVINSLGKYTVVEVQLRSVPPFAVAIFWALGASYCSFKFQNRTIPAVISMCLHVIGYAIAIGTKNSHARYAACFLNVAGDTASGALFLTWGQDNSAPDTMRAVTSASLPIFGALGSVIAVWTYLPNDAPSQFHNGNTLNLALGSSVVVLTIGLNVYLRRENAKRQRGERDYRLEGLDNDAQYQLGYKHPQFRYQT